MGKKSGGRVRVKQMGAPKMPTNLLEELSVPPEEIINLPTKPDSNSGYLIWPMEQTFTINYKEFSAVYPNYLDSNKTVKLGRRIAAKYSVAEPTVKDIHEALIKLNIRHVIQPHKGYSRDASSQWSNPGRILVDLKGDVENFDLVNVIPEMGDVVLSNGNQEINECSGTGKKRLLKKLAATIGGLPNRQRRLEEKSKFLEEKKLKAAKAEKEAAKSKIGGSGGGGGNRKKKGKKRK